MRAMRTSETITIPALPSEEETLAAGNVRRPYACRASGRIRGRASTFKWWGSAASARQAAARAKTELADAVDVLFGPGDRRARRDALANLSEFEVEESQTRGRQNYLSVECRWPMRLWRTLAPRIGPSWTRRPLSRGEARTYGDIALGSDKALLQAAMADPHGAEFVAGADLRRAPGSDRISSSVSSHATAAEVIELAWASRRLLCHIAMRALDELPQYDGQLEASVPARIASQASATLRALRGATAATDAGPLLRMLEEELRPDLARMLL